MAMQLGKNGVVSTEVDRYQADVSWQPCPGSECTYIHAQIADLKLESKIQTPPRRGCVLACPPTQTDVRSVWNNLVKRARDQAWGVPVCLEAVIREMEKELRDYGI